MHASRTLLHIRQLDKFFTKMKSRNSAALWLLLLDYITMQGPMNVKLLVFLQSKPWQYSDAACFHGNESYTNTPQRYVTHALYTKLYNK
jgi:hypothetical protein